jgi:hypothetical protein
MAQPAPLAATTAFHDGTCQAIADLVHTLKSVQSACFWWLLCTDGWLGGMLLIAARFYDVDREVRARVRKAVTSTALRNKTGNKNTFLV